MVENTEISADEIIDSFPWGISVVDRGGKVVVWNRLAEELTGVNRNQLLQKTIFENPEPRIYPLAEKIRDSLDSNSFFQSINCFSVKGSSREVFSTGKIIIDKQGEISGLVILLKEEREQEVRAKDRREQKDIKVPVHLGEMTAMLEELSRVKSQFLSTISHELRTPLNSIIGFSEILIDRTFGQINEKQERYIKNIYQSGKHLLSMINDILDLNRVGEWKSMLSPGEFPLSKVFNSIQGILKIPALKKNISLTLAVDEKISLVQADEVKLKKIIYNLVDNAIKFTPPGGKVEVEGRPLDENFIRISVVDSGMGISIDNRKRIFEKFEQIDGDLTRKYEGVGLGLTVTKRLVELHGGKIWVEGKKGKGSEFIFTIPKKIKRFACGHE